MNLIFDLDGTLVQSHTRLYKLFQHLVPASSLNFEAYWACKRRMKGHPEILKNQIGYEPLQIAEFEREWLALIEHPDWIAFDRPFDGVTEMLRALAPGRRLYLLTARQSEATALKQLTSFAWDGLFTDVFVTGQKKNKEEMIRGQVAIGPEDWMIGDTGIDILTGKALNIRTAAVLSGFRERDVLLPYKPDVILDSVLQFPAILQADSKSASITFESA